MKHVLCSFLLACGLQSFAQDVPAPHVELADIVLCVEDMPGLVIKENLSGTWSAQASSELAYPQHAQTATMNGVHIRVLYVEHPSVIAFQNNLDTRNGP